MYPPSRQHFHTGPLLPLYFSSKFRALAEPIPSRLQAFWILLRRGFRALLLLCLNPSDSLRSVQCKIRRVVCNPLAGRFLVAFGCSTDWPLHNSDPWLGTGKLVELPGLRTVSGNSQGRLCAESYTGLSCRCNHHDTVNFVIAESGPIQHFS